VESEEDRKRWNAKHAKTPAVTPTPPLGVNAESLPWAGRALDVACGTGGVSLWMAQRGLTVTAMDVSDEALRILSEASQEHNLAVKTVQADLMKDIPAEGYFDLIVCQRFRAPDTYSRLISLLAPGGTLVLSVLSQVGHDGKVSQYRASPGETFAAFSTALYVVSCNEGKGISTLVARKMEDAVQLSLPDWIRPSAAVRYGKNIGTIRYIGELSSNHPGYWIGIEWDDKEGDNSGDMDKQQYFECSAPGRGSFFLAKEVEKLMVPCS